MITFIPHHVPLKSQINQGAFVRVASLVSFIKSDSKNGLLIPSRLCFDYISGLIIILTKIRFDKNKTILFSYPNLPFFDTNPINYFFFNTFINLVKRLCLKLNKKIILDVDDIPSISESYLRQWPLSKKRLQRLKIMEKKLFDTADIIWVITKKQAEVMGKIYSIDEKKFILAPNGNLRLDTKPKLSANGKIKFVYAGAFFWAGIKEMINSFTKLKTDQEVEFYLLGPYSKWLKPYLKELDDPRIKFLGSLDSKACEAIVKSCNIGILCYDPKEKYYALAHPVKLSLYITCEVPMISTRVSGIADFIEQHRVGIISDFPDMTPAMKELAENEALRQELANNCQRIKEDYYYDTIYQKALAESLRRLGLEAERK